MWVEHALNKEKVVNMFGGFLDMANAELIGVYIHEEYAVRFLFCIKGIPDNHPEKWDGKGYNSMTVSLRFFGIKKFEANLIKAGFNCCPDVRSSAGVASINIVSEGGAIFCESEFVSIEDIAPRDDIRWA